MARADFVLPIVLLSVVVASIVLIQVYQPHSEFQPVKRDIVTTTTDTDTTTDTTSTTSTSTTTASTSTSTSTTFSFTRPNTTTTLAPAPTDAPECTTGMQIGPTISDYGTILSMDGDVFAVANINNVSMYGFSGKLGVTLAGGTAVSIKNETVAIGNPPHVRTFDYNGTAWIQKGLTLSNSAMSGFGSSVSLSDTHLLIGAFNISRAFMLQLYGNSWVLVRTFASTDSQFGISVSVGASYVAIASASNVKVYNFAGSQIGQTLNTTGKFVTLFGSSIAIVFGSSTKVYYLNGNTWVQQGLTLLGYVKPGGLGNNTLTLMNGATPKILSWNGVSWVQKWTGGAGSFITLGSKYAVAQHNGELIKRYCVTPSGGTTATTTTTSTTTLAPDITIGTATPEPCPIGSQIGQSLPYLTDSYMGNNLIVYANYALNAVEFYSLVTNTWTRIGSIAGGLDIGSFIISQGLVAILSSDTLKVYQYVSNSWTLLGNSIEGDLVSFSYPYIAIRGSGNIQLYKYIQPVWTIQHTYTGIVGDSLSISGLNIAIGTKVSDSLVIARVFDFDGNQIGQTIEENQPDALDGIRLILHDSSLAVWSDYFDFELTGVKVFSLVGNTWTQLGGKFQSAEGNRGGWFTTNTLAVAYYAGAGEGYVSGKVYKWNGSEWILALTLPPTTSVFSEVNRMLISTTSGMSVLCI